MQARSGLLYILTEFSTMDAGDLFVSVQVASAEDFTREGEYDVVRRASISVWRAALGGTVTVQLLDGNTALSVWRDMPF